MAMMKHQRSYMIINTEPDIKRCNLRSVEYETIYL